MKHKCVDLFSLGVGEECSDESMYRPFACKEGLVCGYNSSSSTGNSCQELKTKLEDNIPCGDDEDDNCPSDSECECNSITGKMQCAPLPYSDRKGYEYYTKKEKYEGNNEKMYLAYYKAWCTMYEPYNEECVHWRLPSP